MLSKICQKFHDLDRCSLDMRWQATPRVSLGAFNREFVQQRARCIGVHVVQPVVDEQGDTIPALLPVVLPELK